MTKGVWCPFPDVVCHLKYFFILPVLVSQGRRNLPVS